MSDYQVIARKFRPQRFSDVIGQDAIVVTLKNAIKNNRLAQAYLFCGSRGTGKTTLARIFAKALNCLQLDENYEPCNQCVACREITNGSSLDVLEIDGASNRGIEDIRQINENVGYASSGRYKIYLIDEVHMLTKEAFNALLKTLEEPPPKVKFFFATTEPHKVLPTILSRCQRFNLNRISTEKIVSKLSMIAQRLGVTVEEEALHILARHAEGGLRDAESLFDQILSFEEGKITGGSVNAILGLMSKETYFELDRSGKEGNLGKAFEISHTVFSQGKDLLHFIDGLIEHYRTLLLIKLSGKEASLAGLSSTEQQMYEASAQLYSQEQCLNLMEYLIQAQNQFRFASSPKVALEAILLHIIRSHFRVPIELLVRRLSEIEQVIQNGKANEPVVTPFPLSPPPSPSIPQPAYTKPVPEPEKKSNQEIKIQVPKVDKIPISSMSIDPTPSLEDLGKKNQKPNPPIQQTIKKTDQPPRANSTKPAASTLSIKNFTDANLSKPIHHYDTLIQFAAVELEGKIQKA